MEKIDNYKASFNPFCFKDALELNINNHTNPKYYYKVINEWAEVRSENIKESNGTIDTSYHT